MPPDKFYLYSGINIFMSGHTKNIIFKLLKPSIQPEPRETYEPKSKYNLKIQSLHNLLTYSLRTKGYGINTSIYQGVTSIIQKLNKKQDSSYFNVTKQFTQLRFHISV